MAAAIEYSLLSKIVQEREFNTVLKMKITDDFFVAPDCKMLFNFLNVHFHQRTTYGTIPGWEIVSRHFPYFPFNWYVQEPIAVLCEEIRTTNLRSQLIQFSERIATEAAADPRKALSTLREASLTITAQHELTDDLLLSDAHDALMKEYDTVAAGQGLTGIPWPWDIMNDATQGIHPSDYIIIYGRPKMKKTWIGILIAVKAYLEGDARVLFTSYEMDVIDILRRAASIMAGIDYEKYKAGQLNPADKKTVFDQLAHLKKDDEGYKNGKGHCPAFLAASGRGEGCSFLRSKIEEFKPDLVVVDSFYLMMDERTKQRSAEWKVTTNISRDLRATTLDMGVPIIGITQANRNADKSGKQSDLVEVAYSDAIGQDCTLSMRVHSQKDEQGNHESIISLPGARETTLEGFYINSVPGYNFTFKHIYTKDNSNNPPPGTGGGNTGSGGGGGGGGGGGKRKKSQPFVPPALPNWPGAPRV